MRANPFRQATSAPGTRAWARVTALQTREAGLLR